MRKLKWEYEPLKTSISKNLATVLSVCVLTGCASAPDPQPVAEPVEAVVPETAMLNFVDGIALMQGGEDARARDIFEQLSEAYPQYSGPWINLGILHANAGRAEDAEAAFGEALRADSANAVAWTELGILYRQQGRFQDSREAYEQAIAADPQYALAYRNYGILLDLYLAEPAAALAAYQSYQALDTEQDEQIERWIVEVSRRVDADQRTAQVSK